MAGAILAAGLAGAASAELAVATGTASAASGTVNVTLQPDRAGAASTLHVSAQGPFASQSQLPTQVEGLFARGFKADPRSTKAKCSSGSGGGRCPSASQIGAGEAVFHVTTSVGVGSGDYTASFKLFLGPPAQTGDVASVVLQGSLAGNQFTTRGRLFKLGSGPYGLELVADLPREQPPPGVTVTATLEKLTLTAGAKRKVSSKRRHHRGSRTHSLITNPSSCAQGSWPGQLVEVFSDGSSQAFNFAAPCRPR